MIGYVLLLLAMFCCSAMGGVVALSISRRGPIGPTVYCLIVNNGEGDAVVGVYANSKRAGREAAMYTDAYVLMAQIA